MGISKEERKLKQNIRKGLRKNQSVSVSSGGVVTGGGGDKVKQSGRGRRTVAKKIAAEVTAGANFDNATVTAKVNKPKNKIVSKVPVSGSSVSETRTNNRGTVINKTTETVNTEKTKSKRPSKFRADYGITRNTNEVDNRETKTSLTQGKRESAGSVEVQGIPSRLGNSFRFAGGKGDGLARTIKNANQGISDVRERSNQGLTNKSKSGFFMKSSPFNKPGDADEVFSVNRTSPQPGVDTSTTSASFNTPGRKVERQAETPEEINAWINASQENKDKYKPGKSFSGSSTSSTVSLDKVSPNVIKKEVIGDYKPASSTYESAPDGIIEKVTPSSSNKISTSRTRVDRKKIRQDNRIERKANRKQGKLDKQGGGTNCRMVCD